MAASHAAVTDELLVRYLDAWTPSMLHRYKRLTYVGDGDPGAALRVFGEFADRLAGHEVTALLVDAPPGTVAAVLAELGDPAGLTVRTVATLPPLTGDAPVFACLDAPPPELVGTVAAHRNGELLATGVEGPLRGFGLAVHVELVDTAGAVQPLAFGTPSVKHLEKFKDALWAVDEYAGVRYRDPRDPDHEAVDISLTPRAGPLRRMLRAALAERGEQTVAQLRRYALAETMYRGTDATKAVAELVAAGAVRRVPERGRLVPDTVIRPA